ELHCMPRVLSVLPPRSSNVGRGLSPSLISTLLNGVRLRSRYTGGTTFTRAAILFSVGGLSLVANLETITWYVPGLTGRLSCLPVLRTNTPLASVVVLCMPSDKSVFGTNSSWASASGFPLRRTSPFTSVVGPSSEVQPTSGPVRIRRRTQRPQRLRVTVCSL